MKTGTCAKLTRNVGIEIEAETVNQYWEIA